MSKKKAAPAPALNLDLLEGTCDVAQLGIKIGELWSARDAAEERMKQNPAEVGKKIVHEIDDWRQRLVELAAIQRAESLAGAMVQVALLSDGVNDLKENDLDDEEKEDICKGMAQMLQSVAIMLRRAMGEQAYSTISEMCDVYLHTNIMDGNEVSALTWMDVLPKLIAEERARRRRDDAKLAAKKLKDARGIASAPVMANEEATGVTK